MKVVLITLALAISISVQSSGASDVAPSTQQASWSIEAVHGPAVDFAVDLDEATWMSVDVSADGETLVFDILGDIYTLPIAGGRATRITQGPAYDAQPRFSPDGKRIAFVSDRSGSSNVWVMGLDGGQPRPVTRHKDFTFKSPDWTSDGNYIVVSRYDDVNVTPKAARSKFDAHELHMVHVDGGSGFRLVGKTHDPLGAAASPDGRWIYFNQLGSEQVSIARFDRMSGDIHPLIGGQGGAVRPTPSPDGRWLAFGRRFDSQQRMVLRDLASGAERVLEAMLDWDQYDHRGSDVDMLPGFAFTPDSSAIIYSAGGKLWRHDLRRNSSSMIPFRARFEQTLQRRVSAKNHIGDGAIAPRLLRWTHESPDGRSLFFSAAGKNYRYDIQSRRVAPIGDGAGLEYSPAVSPDGRWLAYVTWSDAEGGHIYKTSTARDKPVRLTQRAGHYEHLSWSADGRKLLFVQSSGGELRGEASLEESYRKTIGWLRVDRAGPVHPIVSVAPRGGRRQEMRPFFDRSGGRVYFAESPAGREPTLLCSARLDGSDKREHLKFRFAEDIVPSPDEQWVAFTEHFEVYLTALPQAGAKPIEVNLEQRSLPIGRLSDEGGYFVNWAQNGQALTWGWGPDYYRISLADALRRLRGDPAKATKTKVSFTEPRAMPHGQLLFRGARVITMGGAGVIEHGDLLIENSRIKAVAPAGQIAPPAGTHVIDVSGKTIMPGLIDIHMHHPSLDTEVFPQNDWAYVAQLAYGVTTIRNPSARSQAVFTQAEMSDLGRTLAPRIFSGGEPLYFALPFGRPVRDLADARAQVKRLKRLGATMIKQYMLPRREQRQWIVQSAREEGIPVVAEGAWKIFHNLTTVMDGHSTLEHAFKTEVLYKDVRSLMVAAGTYYTPTYVVSSRGSSLEYFFQKSDVLEDDKLLRFTPYDYIAPLARRRMNRPEADYYFKRLAESAAKIHQEGGNVAFGAHGNVPGLGAHWELWASAMGGLPPLEVLKTATINSAAAIGVEDDIGSLEGGKLADLVVLDLNPLDDIRNSNSVHYVMKNGLLWQAETMDRVWPEEEHFSGFYWQRRNSRMPSSTSMPDQTVSP